MVFCGQCGYQLGPGDTICPRCGARAGANLGNEQPDVYTPENAPTQAPAAPSLGSQFRQPSPQAPFILGPVSLNEQLANETTTLMESQMYAPPAAYPQQTAGGMYGYPAGYLPYPTAREATALQLLESSRKGKIASLLLILFGLLFLIGAMLVFLLTQQGILFAG